MENKTRCCGNCKRFSGCSSATTNRSKVSGWCIRRRQHVRRRDCCDQWKEEYAEWQH